MAKIILDPVNEAICCSFQKTFHKVIIFCHLNLLVGWGVYIMVLLLILAKILEIYAHSEMSKTIRLKKGLNIRILGKAEPVLENAPDAGFYALKPGDFPGVTPRISVIPGQEVKAGEPLFRDKYTPEICFVSPVGGIVTAVNRGERRRILEVVVREDQSIGSLDFGKANPDKMEAYQIKEFLLKSGLWPLLKRRPYGVLARPNEAPKSIFVSCFDTAPLAPDYQYILKGQESVFQTGITVLSKLTSGKVHLGIPADPGHICSGMKNAEITLYDGPHPAGNAGVQMHHTDPLNKGEVIWTIHPQDLLFIGRLFETGKVDFSKIIALAGSEVKTPRYYKTIVGANLAPLLEDRLHANSENRIISGNVLTGKKVQSDGFLGFYDDLVTVIPEGKYYEFLGWAKTRTKYFSMSHAYFSWLMPGKMYKPDANLHGEKRAYVMTGQYEKVVPMDILPVQLIKAILADDIEKMEKLGIYEVVEEDLALCEFVCTSKIEVQDILRSGINLMIKELG
jgi:Na+-transporting NADH:ubiquinone oxidoreductase subunit A